MQTKQEGAHQKVQHLKVLIDPCIYGKKRVFRRRGGDKDVYTHSSFLNYIQGSKWIERLYREASHIGDRFWLIWALKRVRSTVDVNYRLGLHKNLSFLVEDFATLLFPKVVSLYLETQHRLYQNLQDVRFKENVWKIFINF